MNKIDGYKIDSNGKIKKVTVNESDVTDWFMMIYRLPRVEMAFPVIAYRKLTGSHIDSTEETPAEKVISEHPERAGKLLECLAALYQVHAYKKLMKDYKAGKVSPGLAELLNVYVADNNEIIGAAMDGQYKALVLQAEAEGTLDFKPYNYQHDTAPDWFTKYRLTTHAIPGLYGAVKNLDREITGKSTLATLHENAKAEIKATVWGLLEDGTPPENILHIAEEIKEQYTKNKKAKNSNRLNHIFGFSGEYGTGFIVDVKHAKIYDLRPFTGELMELLEPDYEPLKEFYYAVDRYTKGFTRNKDTTTLPTDTSFIGKAPFLMMRNSRESNAIASVSGSMMQIAVQQELALETEDRYNYTAKVPMKEGEVIISVKETPKGGVLRPSTEKLHILFDTLFTKSGYNEFVFPIDAYMELCKRTPGTITPENRRKFRQKLRQDLQRMKSTKFSANLPGCKPGEIGILNAWLPAPNNCIYIKLESLYCNSLRQRNAGKMQMPITIFKTNEQNPHLIPIMRALCRNRTDYNNINAEAVTGSNRAHNISLKTLYEWDLALPRWEKVSKGSRQFRRDIIEPLFNAIKELNEENYITSRYIDPDGIEHTPGAMEAARIVDILDPKKWLLQYELVGFKDDPVMIQEALARRKEREDKRIQAAAKEMAKKLAEKQKGKPKKKQ